MRLKAAFKLGALLAATLLGGSPAFARQPGPCNTVTEATDGRTVLATAPARICQVEYINTHASADGYARVFDSSDGTLTGHSVKNKSEPGATGGSSAFRDYGDEGIVTEFGLGVEVLNGRALIRWGS